jgi:RNA recognition motif-containing protein
VRGFTQAGRFLTIAPQPHSATSLHATTTAMEVYLQNLPPDLTDQGLKEQLSRFTKALSIQDWSCQKPRKRPFGFLTFLYQEDGERFLEQFQQRPDSGINLADIARSTARLIISGYNVGCKRSNKPPDEFLIKSLIKSAEDRLQPQQ